MASANITLKDLANVPTPLLLKAAKLRNSEMKRKHGPYAAQKKLVKCPGCKKKFGVRELKQRHMIVVVAKGQHPWRRRVCPDKKK